MASSNTISGDANKTSDSDGSNEKDAAAGSPSSSTTTTTAHNPSEAKETPAPYQYKAPQTYAGVSSMGLSSINKPGGGFKFKMSSQK